MEKKNILEILEISAPSAQSKDYVNNQSQFHLHNLLTEQRHAKTHNLSSLTAQNIELGLERILQVDFDLTEKIDQILNNLSLLEQAAKSVEYTILNRRKIFVYGCGATGRLAKAIESALWRPFWKKVKLNKSIWNKLNKHFSGKIDYDIESALIGEITGADRALVSSLEGFEDLELIGKLQLHDHNIEKGDVVFAVTEGGETSSVIGAILEASNFYSNHEDAKSKLYFIYNNPDSVLAPFDRSRRVLENENITKIPLVTGPQAISGSTRMQATTISTFILGIILENAIHSFLKDFLNKEEMENIGFFKDLNLYERLSSFKNIQQSLYNSRNILSKLVELESLCYKKGGFSTYFAKKALITVFTDATERSPTFNLSPLDNVKETKRRSLIQVWTAATKPDEAWKEFLGREFKGLDPNKYKPFFSSSELIPNQFLRQTATNSLNYATNDEQYLYDFSLSNFNIKNRLPQHNDFGVIVLLSEEINEFINSDASEFQRVLQMFMNQRTKIAIIVVIEKEMNDSNHIIEKIETLTSNQAFVLPIQIDSSNDPLTLRQQIGLKMLLNSHSTCVMTNLGKVVGNTMINVRPGNLKLIGRATNLILMHTNEALSKVANLNSKLSYEEANAILFEAIEYCNIKISQNDLSNSSQVSLSIIRILEAFKTKENVRWEKAESILIEHGGLEEYLFSYKV